MVHQAQFQRLVRSGYRILQPWQQHRSRPNRWNFAVGRIPPTYIRRGWQIDQMGAGPALNRRLSMNLGWFGVPPLGGSNDLDRLKPGLQTGDVPRTSSWSQCTVAKPRGHSMKSYHILIAVLGLCIDAAM